MQIQRIKLPTEGNDEYPLPEDWRDLTKDGQRQARVAALRQWQLYTAEYGDTKAELQHKRECRALAFDAGVEFFDRYYLAPQYVDGDLIFDPMFYAGRPLPNAEFHHVLNRHYAIDRKVAMVAMRGGAKSVALQKPMMLCMLTQPKYDIIYGTASNPLVERVGSAMKFQLYENDRIRDDWDPEYNGRLKPTRGEGPQGMQHFALSNRSTFFGMSAESRQRGGRPTKYVLDDPEYDPASTTSMEERRDFMERLLFNIALPMVQQFQTGIIWVGTYVSLRHYLWFAMKTEQVRDGGKVIERAADVRFSGWTRIECPAAIEDEDGKLHSCWPQLHPLDDEEREQYKLPEGVQTLEAIEAEIGKAAFASEYKCKPGEGGTAFFEAITEAKHGYWFKDADQLLLDKPWKSQAAICWWRENVVIEMQLFEFLRRFRSFVCCDTAYTNTPDSDFKVCGCMTLSDHNELFVLDLFDTKDRQEKLLIESFVMADRWHSAAIGTEAIKAGLTLFENQCDVVKTRAYEVAGVAHLPGVLPIRPGNIDKESRISAALSWRIEYGLIKLPTRLKDKLPWRRLFEQILSFTPYLRDGGLEKDDHLDVVHMHRYMVHAKPPTPIPDEEAVTDPVEQLKAGQLIDKAGLPLAWSALHRMDRNDIATILDQHTKNVQPTGKSHV